jgi:hypothetical protein
MRRRLAAVGVLLAIVGAAVANLALTPAASQVTSNRFTVTFPKSRPDKVIDVGKRGFSPGDMFIFRGNLTKSGKTVGRIWAKATILRLKRGLALAEATFRIRGQGQLTAQGRIYFNRKDQGKLAITGGTGNYKQASGSVKSTAFKKVRLHFRLVTP